MFLKHFETVTNPSFPILLPNTSKLCMGCDKRSMASQTHLIPGTAFICSFISPINNCLMLRTQRKRWESLVLKIIV